MGKELVKQGLWRQAIFHDLSKFHLLEIMGYVYHNHDNYLIRKDWQELRRKVSILHGSKNPHHFEYWRGEDIPQRYISEMIIDWKMAWLMKTSSEVNKNYRQTYGHWWDWYKESKTNLSKNTKKYIDKIIEEEKCVS